MTNSLWAARLAQATMLVLATIGAMTPAQSATQLFKCVIDKRTVYQQQACPVNAEPATAASAPPSAPAAHGTGTAASAPARALKPSRPASSAPATPR